MKTHILRSHERQLHSSFGDFVCMNCRNFVSAEAGLSGVHHRNHCPYCLTSRHLDLYKAGDRLSACKASMRPVALTIKRTLKKYSSERMGEIMLVHQCIECGKISVNRIAADDSSRILLTVYEASLNLDSMENSMIVQKGIALLAADDRHKLNVQLFGRC
jgi:hypothetical protein